MSPSCLLSILGRGGRFPLVLIKRAISIGTNYTEFREAGQIVDTEKYLGISYSTPNKMRHRPIGHVFGPASRSNSYRMRNFPNLAPHKGENYRHMRGNLGGWVSDVDVIMGYLVGMI